MKMHAHTHTLELTRDRNGNYLALAAKACKNAQIITTQTQAFMTGKSPFKGESCFKKIGLKPKLPWRPRKVEISNMERATASSGERLFRIDKRKWVDLLKLF